MPETVDVIIPVYGERMFWAPFAARAKESALVQTVLPYTVYTPVSVEGPLGKVRNQGAARSNADWLIFLDADDELDPFYIQKMLEGSGDIRQPSTLGVHADGHEDDYPVLIPRKASYMVGNHLIIGCMMRRSIFEAVGGFHDLPALEDWELFIRMRLAGAEVGECPGAIYRVHVRENSRNKDVGMHARIYAQIQSTYQIDWANKFGRDW